MIQRLKHHRIVAAALAAALVLGLIEIIDPALKAPGRADMVNAAGALARSIAALFTPAPSLLRAGSDRLVLAHQLYLGVLVAGTALFMLLYYRCMQVAGRRPPSVLLALLAGQMLIAVCLRSSLLVVVAAQLALYLPWRRGLAWLGLQVLLSYGAAVLFLLRADLGLNDGLMFRGLMYLGFDQLVQLLVFAMAWLAGSEWRSRRALAAANAQLHATQALLADTVRASERMRIARDLHDAVGHHLTALNLHLDLAFRQAEGQAAPALRTAHELARSLLGEVRAVVSAERSERQIDVRAAVQALCDGIPSPVIALSIATDVELHSPAAAHALFCSIQEAISNAVRHSGAATLRIAIGSRDGQVHVCIADDGRGSAAGEEGNGLRGMRERLAQLGGVLTAGNRTPRGFGLEFSLPAAGVGA